jgi:4-hydroxy-tetrahydrodipicolinate reductase
VTTTTPIKVVQWATGNIGTRAMRAVIEHPELELVGLWVHSADKAGRDAAELVGLDEPTGVVATNDVDEIVGFDADVVLYMPQGCDFDVVCRLLASGKDVVTTRGEFHRPASLPDDVRAKVEQACDEGGTSIHSTGSSPGFITEAVPIVLTSLSRRVDRLTIEEFADMSKRPSPQLMFDIMGFGKDPADLKPGRAQHLQHAFGPSLQVTAEALGLPLDGFESSEELAVATADTEVAAGTVKAGTVGGMRTVISGMRGGEELIRFVATWWCVDDLDQQWDVLPTGWRVRVAGDVPMDVRLEFDVPIERMAEHSPGFTAHRAVNAVRVVHEAPPGIRTTPELPQVIARLS